MIRNFTVISVTLALALLQFGSPSFAESHPSSFETIEGAFGLKIGENVQVATDIGFKKSETSPGFAYRKREDGEFFQIKEVQVTAISQFITSIEAMRFYNIASIDECRKDLLIISDGIETRYPTLDRGNEEPVSGLDEAKYVTYISRSKVTGERGRRIEIVCGKSDKFAVLSLKYKASTEEYKSAWQELMAYRKAQADERKQDFSEELEKRGLKLEDF